MAWLTFWWMVLAAWVAAFAKNKSSVSRRKIIRSTTIYVPRNLILMKPDSLQKLSPMYMLGVITRNYFAR